MSQEWLIFWAVSPLLFAWARMYMTFLPFPTMGGIAVPIGTLVTGVVAVLVWGVPFLQAAAGALQGLALCVEIVFLLFSSILLLQTLRQSGVFTVIGSEFSTITRDRRVQMILIAWLFGSGAEGLFGFSATGAACALLMVGIGFPPACAVLMGVMGPMTASAFSSMGTPITLGLAGGLQEPSFQNHLFMNGVSMEEFLRAVTAKVGVFHGIAGTFLPVVMVFSMTRFFGSNRDWKENLDILPFALFAGLAFTVPFALTAIYLGPEYPPLMGCIIGMVATVTAIKTGFLMPKRTWDFVPKRRWEPNWTAGKFIPDPVVPLSRWKAWFPFVLLFVLLAATRFPSSPLQSWAYSLEWTWRDVFGAPVSISTRPLYLPGIYFLIVAFICIGMYQLSYTRVGKAFGSWTMPITFMTLQFAPMVMMMAGIYWNTAFNANGYPSMPHVAADWIARMPGADWWGTFLSPFAGAVAAFYSGNNIFGNAVLAPFQYGLGENMMNHGTLFLALHIVGASACNIISLHFLSGTCEVVGMPDWESPTGRKAALPMLIYLAITGTAGIVAIHFL